MNLFKSLKSRHLLVSRVIALLEKLSMHPGPDVTHDSLVKIKEGLKFKIPL